MGGLQEQQRPVGLEGASSVTFDTPSGRYAVLTGQATFELVARTPDWSHLPLRVNLPIPELPATMGLKVISIAAVVSLAAVSNDESAANAGWKVHPAHGDPPGTVIREVGLLFGVGARGVGSHITSVSYTVHLLGSLTQVIGQPPPMNR